MTKTVTPTPNAVEVGFSKEVREAYALFNEAKAQAKRAEEIKKNAEPILRKALGTATVATVGGVKAFSLESRKRTVVDTARLEKDFEDIFKLLSSITEYDFIKTV
jgi:predicted phage-related endonuclease